MYLLVSRILTNKFVSPDLAQQLKDAGLDDEYEDEISESVSTLQSEEEDIITDFEALADVEVEGGEVVAAIEGDK